VIDRIRRARPEILLVALGAPKQELWLHRVGPRISPTVGIGLGAALDFVAGAARRAPAWMSRAGLEWLFRLLQEPRRLSRRYLLDDPKFLLILYRMLRTPRALRTRWSELTVAPGSGRGASAARVTSSRAPRVPIAARKRRRPREPHVGL